MIFSWRNRNNRINNHQIHNNREIIHMAGDLTSMIINTAAALNAQRVQATQSVAVLDKALEVERGIALSLIQSVAPSPGTGGQIDLVA